MNGDPIAIIGMGCRFPKAPNPDAFWEMLEGGVDAITEAPSARWDVDAFYHPLPRTPGKMCTRWGGFLEDVYGFDPLFFRIMPSRAGRIDPQHRLVLEVAWEALEHAGIDAAGLAYSATGVFIGISHSDHDRLLYQDQLGIDGHNGPNTYHCFAANRLSYFLNVRGPSMAVDTACSSSLVAVHLACQSLRSGEIDLAFAGGVNLNLTPEEFVALSFLGVLSGDGRCKTFDERADGYGRGEGCGIVVLKRLADALAAGDTVLAVIRGSAVNHNGLSNGITAPNGAAQQEVLRRALRAAAVDPAQVSQIEAMGTGTALGDQIEMAALKAVYSENRAPDQPLWIGAVKTNLGHLEAASGMASLIKIVLSLQHRRIPPHLHLGQLSPHITLGGTSFAIPTRSEPWQSPAGRRVAAVSAFGFGGTNAHMIVEEAPAPEPLVPAVDRPLHVLTLSARNPEALADLTRRYLTFARTHPALSLADVCFTANVGRRHFDHRLAIVTKTMDQLCEQLEAFVSEAVVPGLFRGKVGRDGPKLAFVFPRRAHAGMVQQLYATQLAFRRAFDSCVKWLSVDAGKESSFLAGSPDGAGDIDEGARIFSIEYALAALWKSWGVEPDVVVGDGPGEYVAACVAGVFTVRDGLTLILGQRPHAGAAPGRVSADRGFTTGGGQAVRAPTSRPDPEPLVFAAPRIGFVCRSGRLAGDEIRSAAYWWGGGVSRPLDTAAATESLSRQRVDFLVPAGSSGIGSDEEPRLMEHERCLPGLGQATGEDWTALLNTLAALYVRGAPISWSAFDSEYARLRLQLPTYPFQRRPYRISETGGAPTGSPS